MMDLGKRRDLCAIILSRKGFDGTAGGGPSPIFADGKMLSLPIPEKNSTIRYCDIHWNGEDLGRLVADLTNGRIRPDYRAHLDPDIRSDSVSRLAGWRPLFGQCGASQGHLRNCGISEGDIFLFFGVFRRAITTHGRYAWDRDSRPIHVIWGWMQVESVVSLDHTTSVPAWADYHPHCGLREEKNNTLYTSAPLLCLPRLTASRLPGSGIFTHFSPRLQLTDVGAARHGQWRLPSWMFPEGKPPLSFHADLGRWSRQDDWTILHSVDRGQEFVLDAEHYPEAAEWISELVQPHAGVGASSAK